MNIATSTSPGTTPPDRGEREPVVVIRGLTKIFKDFWGRPKARAIDGVTFDVRRGEVFGLLGPNGSGKSTTIKILLGLLHPSAGHVEVFGHSPAHVQTKARIGYLPEESYLYRFLNSDETLDFFGGLFRLPKHERDQRVAQLLEMVGLKSVHRRAVGEFSKGMQRRIGLAQALINDPDLVILDEPTAGLDPVGCREVKDLILALARRGKTVILSSHLLADVEDVCDRVVVYYGGKIQALGTMQELLATPDSLRITTPSLSRELVEKVVKLIESEASRDTVRVDTPTRNLESYFLDLVEKARNAGGQTSGATSGNQVAQFIRGNAEADPPRQKVLDRLVKSPPAVGPGAADSSTPAVSPAPTPLEQPSESALRATTEDPARLQKLTERSKLVPVEKTPPSPGVAETQSEKERLKKAEDRLSSLLNRPKDR